MDEVTLTREGTGNVLRMVRRYKTPVEDARVAAR
jgi:hypothetical protein